MDLIAEARRITDRQIIFIVVTGHGGMTQKEALEAQEVFTVFAQTDLRQGSGSVRAGGVPEAGLLSGPSTRLGQFANLADKNR